MALVRVSGNLNTYGNNGNYETDPSTWGYAAPAGITHERTASEKTKGVYSALVKPTVAEGLFGLIVAMAKAPAIETGKTYQIVAKVRTNGANQIAPDDHELSFEGPIIPFLTLDVRRSVDNIKDNWLEVEGRFVGSLLSGPTTEFILWIYGTTFSIGGELYVDEIEIYEYIMSDEPAPEDPEFDTVYFSKNPIPWTKAAPIGWELLNNFRLYNDVRVEDIAGSGVFNSKLKARLHPDSAGNGVFNSRTAFRDVLTAVPPALNETEIIRLTDRIKFFKHFSGQIQDFENIPEEGDLTPSDALLVLLGGISKEKYPGLNYFADYIPTHKKFLSWAPLVKDVDRLQEDYLNFWIYNTDIAAIKLQVKAYFDDATNEIDIIKEVAGVVYGQLYQVPAGPVNCGALLINPEKNVTHYELSLLDQDNEVITEVRTYRIVQVRHPLTRFFMFLTSLGAYEVLMFSGQAERSTDFDREIVQKFLPHNYAAIDGEFEVNDVTMRDRTSYSSGYIKGQLAKQWKEYMKDFMKSNRVYDITTGKRLKRVITTTTLPGEVDQEYLRFVRFDALDNFNEESYTPDEI